MNFPGEQIRAAMKAHADSVPEIIGPIPKRERSLDKTSMTYWFPIIEAAGLPVPRTKFVEMTDTCRRMMWDLLGGKYSGNAKTEPFFESIEQAAAEMKYPCFLRTSHTSNKHSWKKTCYLTAPEDIPSHVFALVEFSECADFMGIAWDTWAVREFLPTIPYGVCPRYGNFPICMEFRFFVTDGEVNCWHPYWPLESLQQGGWEPEVDEVTAYADLCSVDYPTLSLLKAIASKAGHACGGSWSVDILETERGWILTDMAEAHKSFHWEGCKHGT